MWPADHDQTLTFRAWSWRGIHGTDYLPASFRASATFRCRVITLTFDLWDHRASARACRWWVIVFHPFSKFDVCGPAFPFQR